MLSHLPSLPGLVVLFALLQQLPPVNALFFDGRYKYADGDAVTLYVNKFFSSKTQLPYAYYDVPFTCQPKDVKHKLLNIGEILRGDRSMTSSIVIRMLENVTYAQFCYISSLQESDVGFLRDLIIHEYRTDWTVDDIPAALVSTAADGSNRKQYLLGFPLGHYDSSTDAAYVFNHLHINLYYHTQPGVTPTDARRAIVGFDVVPRSIAGPVASTKPLDVSTDKKLDVGRFSDGTAIKSLTWTYSLEWHEDNTSNGYSKLDVYFNSSDPRIHWYSIINSTVIAAFLTSLIAMIIVRALRQDIDGYNAEDDDADMDTSGWKLLHGDVFRPPKYVWLLCPMLGSGVQFLITISFTSALALFGFINAAYRGNLVSFGLAVFLLSGVFGGYYSSRAYKFFKGNFWKKNAILTALLCPGAILTCGVFVNLFVAYAGASNAVPFTTILLLCVLLLFVSLPLVYVGAYFGFKKAAFEVPVRTNQIPRQIPPQSRWLHLIPSTLVVGLVPFAVIFLELYFVLKSVWQADQYYYILGFGSIVCTLLLVTSVEMAIVLVYLALNTEDYRWTWRSFHAGAASAIYVFLYSVFYFATRLELDHPVSGMLYFSYSLLSLFIYYLCLGTVSFFCTFYFVKIIYSNVKVD